MGLTCICFCFSLCCTFCLLCVVYCEFPLQTGLFGLVVVVVYNEAFVCFYVLQVVLYVGFCFACICDLLFGLLWGFELVRLVMRSLIIKVLLWVSNLTL